MDELGIIFIFLGIYLTFFGSKYANVTLFIAGTLAGTVLSLVNLNDLSLLFRSYFMA